MQLSTTPYTVMHTTEEFFLSNSFFGLGFTTGLYGLFNTKSNNRSNLWAGNVGFGGFLTYETPSETFERGAELWGLFSRTTTQTSGGFVTWSDVERGMRMGGRNTEKTYKNQSILIGTSTDITFASPWGGFVVERGYIGGKEFVSHGNAIGGEVSFGYNMLFLYPKENFKIQDFEGLGYSFGANYAKFFSTYMSGNSTISYPENTLFDTYYLVKVGVGLGIGFSYQETNSNFIKSQSDTFWKLKILKH